MQIQRWGGWAACLMACVVAAPAVVSGQGREAEPAAREAAPKAPAAQRVALIDLDRVYRESHQFQKMLEEFKELQGSKQAKVEQLQQQRQAIVQEVQESGLEAGSDEMAAREQELIKIESSAKTYVQVAKNQLTRRQIEIQAEMYGVVQKALDKFAEANGYAFVLDAHKMESESDNPNELRRVLQQTVAWRRDKDDITESLINYLNQKYDSEAGVQPAGGSAAGKPKATTAEGTRAAPARGTPGAAGPAGATSGGAGTKRPAEGAAPRKPVK
ncbi:MAG: OmpH family outer membrane protein [Planctomycetaceae bacterium]